MPRASTSSSTWAELLATTIGRPAGTPASVRASTGSPRSGATSLLEPNRVERPAASTHTPTWRAASSSTSSASSTASGAAQAAAEPAAPLANATANCACATASIEAVQRS